MKDISFVRYSPHTSESDVTAQVVECYRRVFADGPWHEWKQCPVCKKYWGQKIAKSMVKHRLMDFLKQNLKVGVVRTRDYPESSKTFLWYRNLGYKTVAQYPDGDGRVILTRSLEGLSSVL